MAIFENIQNISGIGAKRSKEKIEGKTKSAREIGLHLEFISLRCSKIESPFLRRHKIERKRREKRKENENPLPFFLVLHTLRTPWKELVKPWNHTFSERRIWLTSFSSSSRSWDPGSRPFLPPKTLSSSS